jgi:hypothetical protein
VPDEEWDAEEYQRRVAECRQGHNWVLFDAHPDWYDGQTYRCDRCDAVEFRCITGATNLYEDPEHDPGYRAVGHEWLFTRKADAPCASTHAECVRCHLQHTRWSDVPHQWVYENPDPSLGDPEWAMGVGLVDWVGERRCIRCGASEYRNPRW